MPSNTQIRIYHVIVKTKKGTFRGILEKSTPDKIYVSGRKAKYSAINAADIRIIKIKEYPRKHRVVNFPVPEPGIMDYTAEGFLTKEYMERAPSLGEEASYSALGIFLTGIYGFFYNQFHSEKVFKPRFKMENYRKEADELGSYAVYNQNASDYDKLLLKGK